MQLKSIKLINFRQFKDLKILFGVYMDKMILKKKNYIIYI